MTDDGDCHRPCPARCTGGPGRGDGRAATGARPGTRAGAGRGRPLRDLRLGHPHDPRGMGQARLGRRPRVDRRHRRRRRRTSTAGRSATPSSAARRRGAAGAGAASRASRRSARTGSGSMTDDLARTARSPTTSSSTRGRCWRCPTASRPARPRWPSRWRSRCTASPGPSIADGDTAMVFGAGPIGALTIAALVARGIGPVTVVEPGDERASSWPATSAPTRCCTPPTSRCSRCGSPSASPTGAVRRRARVLGQEGGDGGRASASCAGAAHGHGRRRHRAADLRPATACCSTSSRCAARSSTTPTASSGRSSCWPPAGCRPTLLIDPDDVPLDRPGRRDGRPGRRSHRGQGDGRAPPYRPDGSGGDRDDPPLLSRRATPGSTTWP